MKIREVCTRTGLTDKAIRKAGFSIQDILKMQQAPQMVQDVMDTHSKKLEADAEAYIAISKKLKSIHVGGGISWQKLADVLMADGENVWNNAELQWPEEMLQVEGGQVMEMREQKDNNVEKRRLMYSQMFNYNLNQASMAGSRNIEVSAAVEGGGKSIASKRNRNIGLAAIATLLACIFGWSFAHEDIAVTVSDFMLEKNGVEMQLAEPDMVTLNMAAIFREENENYASTYNGESERYYSQRYNFWSEVPLSDGMKDHVAEDEEIRFSSYEMRIYEKDKLGRLNVRVIDAGNLYCIFRSG